MFLFRNRIPLIRFFGKLRIYDSIQTLVDQKPAKGRKLEIGYKHIPTYTLGNYDEKINEIVMGYRNSLIVIAGGRYNTDFFNTIYVYTFLERVPLTDAGQVQQLSETEFKITAFDPSSAPSIEISLKNSPYSFEVVRDFENISVVLTVNKEANITVAEKLLTEAKQKISEILEQATKRFGDNKKAVDDIQFIVANAHRKLETIYYAKLAQIN